MEEIAGRYDQQLNRSRQLVIKKEVWAKHYSSNHQILLVGEGDFSFALSLAVSFRSASNIVASSRDSYDDVIRNYKSAKTNLDRLCSLGARLLFGADAYTIDFHPDLHLRKYDRIVYNFPHAGFSGKEDDQGVITMHQNLVSNFFKNASQMLRPKGEVHVSHKTKFPFNYWNIEELASQSCLWLLDRVEFKLEDYPGYINKRGDGLRCDEPFHLGECCTFKFISLSTDLYHRNHQLEEIHLQRANASLFTNLDECFKIFVEYVEHARSTYGQTDWYLFGPGLVHLKSGVERYMAGDRGRGLIGYVDLLEEVRSFSERRIKFVQNREIDHRNSL